MGTTRKTVTITDQQNNWIKAQIAMGEFTNDREYLRNRVRRDQTEKTEIPAIRSALIEGEESGVSERTPADVKAEVKRRLQDNGQLLPD